MSSESSPQYTQHFNQGLLHARALSFQPALHSFSLAISSSPLSAAAYINHGAICNQTGLFDIAIEDFTTAISLSPWDIPAYFNRFIAHFAKLQHKQALQNLNISLSLAYLKEGEITENVESYERAVELVGNNVKALVEWGKLERMGGRDEVGRRCIEEAIEKCQGYREAYLERAAWEKKLGNHENCQKDIDKAFQLPNNPLLPYITLTPKPTPSQQPEILSQLKEKYRIFMELRSFIYTKTSQESLPEHLKVISSFQTTYRETSRENTSQLNNSRRSRSIISGGLSKVERALNKLKKEVDEDKEELTRSLINSRDVSRSRSQCSVSSSNDRKKFTFSSGAGKVTGNVLDELNKKEDGQKKENEKEKEKDNEKQKEEEKSKQADSKKQHKVEQYVVNLKPTIKQQQTKQPPTQKPSLPTHPLTPTSSSILSKKPPAYNIKKSKNQSQQPSTSPSTIEIKILRATILKSTELLGHMTPYCQVKYGRETSRTEPDKGTTPQWGEKFTFKYKKTRGLITLEVYDKETLKKDDYVGEAVVSILDGSTSGQLKREDDEVVGTVEYQIKLL